MKHKNAVDQIKVSGPVSETKLSKIHSNTSKSSRAGIAGSTTGCTAALPDIGYDAVAAEANDEPPEASECNQHSMLALCGGSVVEAVDGGFVAPTKDGAGTAACVDNLDKKALDTECTDSKPVRFDRIDFADTLGMEVARNSLKDPEAARNNTDLHTDADVCLRKDNDKDGRSIDDSASPTMKKKFYKVDGKLYVEVN